MIGYEFSNLNKYKELKYIVTDRLDGFSKNPFDSLNLSLRVGDEKESVLKNREKAVNHLGYQLKDMVVMNLVHGSNVAVITKNDKGKGTSDADSAIKDTDAMITNEKGIVLTVFVADCIPIIIYDPHLQVLAVIHGGWRGLTKNIINKTVNLMIERFGSNPDELIASMGPTICEKCCEIGNEVADIIYKNFPSLAKQVIEKRAGKLYVDLKIAKLQLKEKGVKNIEVSDICTYENKNFYSYRRDKETGRFGVFAVLE